MRRRRACGGTHALAQHRLRPRAHVISAEAQTRALKVYRSGEDAAAARVALQQFTACLVRTLLRTISIQNYYIHVLNLRETRAEPEIYMQQRLRRRRHCSKENQAKECKCVESYSARRKCLILFSFQGQRK